MKNNLALFTESVNTLIEGKLILVDKHIAQVLKCIATTPELCRCLQDTLRGVSYVTEFSRAKVTWTRPDGTVEARLKMPVEHNRLFAFVVCLLMEVDSGRRNFLDFLKEYYHESDTNIGYEKFANEVLKPFKHAGEVILHTVDPESNNAEGASRAERFFDTEKIYIKSEITARLNELIKSTVALFNAQKPEECPKRQEVLFALEYLTHAVYLKNPTILSICWLAVKNLLELHPFAQDILSEMSQLVSQIYN